MVDQTASNDAGLSRYLVRGALAALVAGGLSAAGSAIELMRESTTGFTLSTAIMLVAILPQIIVLLTFLRLAPLVDGMPSGSFCRSSVSVFLSHWLIIATSAVAELMGDAVLLTALSIVILGLSLAALYGYATKREGLSMLAVAFFLIKYLGGWAITGRRFDTSMALGIVVGLLFAITLIVYPVWFAFNLRRARARLGPMAAVLGYLLFINSGAMVFLVAWVMVTLAGAKGHALLDDAALNDLFSRHVHVFTTIGIVGELAIAIATAGLFRTVRPLTPASVAPPPPPPTSFGASATK
jgi:hypothetical protein